jgi:MFS family permease
MRSGVQVDTGLACCGTANLVSNIGTWMQAVGAQWLVVHLPHAAILVSLVQAADYLPDVLFGIVGGVLADIFDRRLLLIVVQLALAVVGLALTVLTYLGEMPPALLLTFTFVIGISSVFTNPAFQSLVPDLVPREQLRAASNLSGISFNIARLVGPHWHDVTPSTASSGMWRHHYRRHTASSRIAPRDGEHESRGMGWLGSRINYMLA